MTNIVELRVYKGKEILRKTDGTVANENQKVTLNYDVFEFEKNIKNLSAQGFFQIELTNLYTDDKAVEKFKTAEGEKTKAEINDQIQTLFKTKAEEKLTDDQRRIKDLEEKLAQVLANQGKTPTEPKAKKTPTEPVEEPKE